MTEEKYFIVKVEKEGRIIIQNEVSEDLSIVKGALVEKGGEFW